MPALNCNTPINQALRRERQIKGKNSEKVTILEVNGAEYKDSKSIANKVGDTLAELYFPQNFDSTLFRTETKGRTENYTCEQRKL